MDKSTIAMIGNQMARQLNESMESEADARIKAQEKLRQEIEYRDSVVAENRAEMAEKAQKEREALFVSEAETAFFKANPNASESDFKRLLPKIKDEFLLNNFRDAVQGTAPEWFSGMN